MQKISLFILIMAVTYTWAFPEPQNGNDVLNKVVNALTGPKDMEADFDMLIGNTGDQVNIEKRSLRIWTMGKEKKVIKFISPSSIKNVGVLALSDDEMYVFLPAYQKDRRIQGNMRDNDFQGTDFSYREMGSYDYTKDYDATITSENSSFYVMDLARKSSSDAPYNKLVMTVDKSNYIPRTIEMYDGNTLKKKLTVIDAEKNGNYWTLMKIRMENLIINHYTEISMKDVKYDTGLDGEGIFTLRFLNQYVQ